MTNNTAPKKVISMTDYQKSAKSITQTEASNVLEDCRDLALGRLTRTLAAMLDKIDDDLSELAEKAHGVDEQNAYRNARREAQFKRSAIEATFKKQFNSLFGEKANRKNEPKPSADPYASFGLELSLVDEKEVEENIAILNMANALQDNCEGELQALAARIGFLLNAPDLDLKANPVSPEVILNTFKAACQQIEVGFTVKLAIMRLFDSYVAKDLPAIYKEMNSRLVSREILPDIRPGYRGKPRPGSASRPSVSQTNGNAGGAARTAENSNEIFTLLQQLLTKSADPLVQTGPAQGGMSYSGLAQSVMSSGNTSGENSASPLSAGFLDSLNRLQHGDAGLMSTVLGERSGEAFAHGTANLLHELRNSALASGVGQFDAITIDIVAMLFDYIFNDPKVPEGMKGLLGRLQIPVLKVAMLDKGFFSSKSHPTRKLLDTLAGAAASRGDKLSENDPLYRETERIAQKVLSEFESDVSIFAQLLAELDAFLANENQKNEETIERSAKILLDRERLEIARVVADEEVRQRVEGTPTITVVRNFLGHYWVHALTNAHAIGGEDGEAWKDAVKAMDELLWSVKPKMTAEDRKYLVTRLPALLKRLHAGMGSISMDAAEQKQFFADLVACHTRAVKAGLGGDSAAPDSKPELAWTVAEEHKTEDNATILDAVNEANVESALIRKSLAEGDVQIEEVSLANLGRTRLLGADDHQLAEIMAKLKRGAWVDFKQPDGNFLRYKLSWVSPLKKVYLFTNISNQKALSITPQAMETQILKGAAVILEDTPLMDRAVENMLESLQK
jgi:hypothetical protein